MDLKYLIIHCTATPGGREITKEWIEHVHLVGRGWNQVGYSELFHLNGDVTRLVDYNDDDIVDKWEITNGARGMNSKSRHIVYAGGVSAKKINGKYKPEDTRTDEQKKSLEEYVKAQTAIHPNWKIAGHYHFAAKACPSFNVEEWLKEIGIPEKNIYTKNKTVFKSNTPFKSKAEGDKFRLWVNNYHSEYAKSINLDKKGSHNNSFILKAYKKLGKDYEKRPNK